MSRTADLRMLAGQRGGFVLGVVVGLLVGLSIALGVALYITKAPVPFVNKVPQRTPEQDQAEQARNRNWDPNAPLAGRPPAKPAAAASAASSTPTTAGAAAGAGAAASTAPAMANASAAAAAGKSARDPAAILSGASVAAPVSSGSSPVARPADPFVYFVQAGAYSRADEAEQQRARLAMLGHAAKVTEREQNGRVVYRVRIGPFEARAEAEALQNRLQEGAVETQLVRVERP